MPRRLACIALCVVASPLGAADWPQFGFDARHSGDNPQESVLARANASTLRLRYRVALPAVADGAPVFVTAVATPVGTEDLLFVTTKNGRIVALDAATGAVVWSHQPASGPNYTTSSPAVDPNRGFVYSYGLEGRVHKYRVGDGLETTSGGWPQRATLKPDVEKGSSALAIATAQGGSSYLYVTNGGYPGDAGDYQGHVTAIDLASGAQRVFNAACSDQTAHFVEGGAPDCAHVQNAIWARSGVVYDPDGDRLFMATGNGDFDANAGGHDWGDSVFALRPDGSGQGGKPLDSYTPVEFQQLEDQDLDLGSTAPAILPTPATSAVRHLAVQGGKDGLLRLLDLDDLSGQGGPGHLGGELQKIAVPQGGEVLTAIAVWVDPADSSTWCFVANDNGISGLELVSGGAGKPALAKRWTSSIGGTSPILANGVLLHASFAGLRALDPRTGVELYRDPTLGGLHWESPIAVNGRVYATDEDGNLSAYEPAAPVPCAADATTLCLDQGRFAVQATWRASGTSSGQAQAVPLTGDTGTFWFFEPSNVEVVVKVLDGCAASSRFWVFAAGLTNLRVVLTVTDTKTGAVVSYVNPRGTAFLPIQDTAAFDTCP